MARFIFIGAADRSGTTLLQRLITAHSRIGGGPQFSGSGFNFTYDLFHLYRRITSEKNYPDIAYFGSREEIKENFKDFYSSFFRNSNLEGCEFVAEKTTKNIYVADVLLDVFSDALFITICRDGRDIIASHYEVDQRNRAKGLGKKFDLKKQALAWNLAVQYFREVQASGRYKDRFYSIRYEDLISEPETTLKNLFTFLGLPFEEQLLHPEKIKNEAGLVDGVWHTRAHFEQGFNSQQIGKWERVLPFLMKVQANYLLAGNLSLMGYKVFSIYLIFKKIWKRISS